VSCRALAVEAQQRQDFETFHDLAWAAYRKGRAGDTELMLLVARAQSLSGRPGDALVMLERIGSAVPPEIAADADFARVRALPRWEELRAKLKVEPAVGVTEPAPASKEPATSVKAPALSPAVPPAPPAKEPTPPAKDPAPPAKTPAPPAKDPVPPKKDLVAPAKTPDPSNSASSARSAKAGAPLSFATVLTPSALVHDAVSKRFIIADRKARRIAVIDGTTGQVSTLVGAQGDLGEIGGVTTDPRQGDLWVVSSGEAGARLHRIQLISGRVLKSVALSGMKGRAVALAFVPDAGLVLADDTGRIMRVGPSGRGEQLGLLEYVPRALAADARGRLYVTAGGPRVARFTVGESLRRADFVELDPDTPPDAPFTVADGRLHFIVPVDSSYEIRSYPIR
jgi:hypothetical protein